MPKYNAADIWKDPRVVDALEDGRSADDIMILNCPKCARFGYYNQGSHFTCLFCDKTFDVLSEGEWAMPGVPTVQADSAVTLIDTLDVGDEP